jgi:hypothetical protein
MTTFTEVSSSKMLPETSGFRTETPGFWTETSGFSNRNFGFFEPKLRVLRTETSGFRTEASGFRIETSCFKPKLLVLQKKNFFVLPKLWVLIPWFLATETSEYQIHTKFLVKFWLSRNWINFRNTGENELLCRTVWLCLEQLFGKHKNWFLTISWSFKINE